MEFAVHLRVFCWVFLKPIIFRAAFILRNPKSRKSYQIFIRPLDTKVWICVIALSCIAVLLQMLSYKLDWKLSNWSSEEKKHVDFSWGFSAVSTFGAFCQQGTLLTL